MSADLPENKKNDQAATSHERRKPAEVTVHIDVAACIRWLLFGLALLILVWSVSGEEAAWAITEIAKIKLSGQ